MTADRSRGGFERLSATLMLLALAGVCGFLALYRGRFVGNIDPAVAYYRSPEVFPGLSLAVAALGSLWLALRAWRQGSEPSEESLPRSQPRPGVVVAIIALFAVYTLALPWLGYPLATGGFVFLGLLLLRFAWTRALGLALAMAGVLWLVFVVGLDVWFPASRLF